MEIEDNEIIREDSPATPATRNLLEGKTREDIERMAACGLSAKQIAAALELSESDKALFCALAAVPTSQLAQILDNGRAMGIANPQYALQRAAAQGNIDAVRALQQFRDKNYFVELLNNMDDDELAL